jgi:hypothetical protein
MDADRNREIVRTGWDNCSQINSHALLFGTVIPSEAAFQAEGGISPQTGATLVIHDRVFHRVKHLKLEDWTLAR